MHMYARFLQKLSLLIGISITTCLLVPSVLFAQISGLSAEDMANLPKDTTPIAVTVIPRFPQPFDHVSIDIDSFATNLDKAQVYWSVNGKTVKSGIGEKHFEIDTGKLGSITRVTLTITTSEGETIHKS